METVIDGFNLANEIFNFVEKEFGKKKKINKEKFIDLIQCSYCKKYYSVNSVHYCWSVKNA